MFRKGWFLLLSILYLQYELTASTNSPTNAPTIAPTDAPTSVPTVAPFTFAPTLPTSPPTHQPTPEPTKSPTWSPTLQLGSDEEIKIVVDVTISGDEIAGLCDMLDDYETSLVDVFVAASGVSSGDVEEATLTTCNTLDNDDVVLTYKMRSENSRSRNTVKKRIASGEFLSTYQANLNLVFNDVEAKKVELIEADRATKEESDDDPFEDFFSAYFGLGVIILVVSAVWCFLLRANESDVDHIRLKQLREEKRQFEEKYGAIEEDSVDAAERDIPKAVELAETNKTSTGNTETKSKPNQTQTQPQVYVQAQAQNTANETNAEPQEPETKPAETAYRASVVNEVKHVTKQEERASLDLDQIKDPGKKRRKTQEYLNNLWDDKNDAKEARDKEVEEGSEEEEEEESEE